MNQLRSAYKADALTVELLVLGATPVPMNKLTITMSLAGPHRMYGLS